VARRVRQRAAVGALGKDLTRRSRGRCELCAAREDVRAFELPPFPEEPSLDRALHACGRCRRWLEGEEIAPLEARFLGEAVWSDVPPVRLAAARLLLRAGFDDDPWLVDALEAADVDPATGELRAPVAEEP
jgi:protein PhnA